ncbi:MAG: HXXEE domain-containing protein [Janthinobacterium lividum]
MNTRPALAPANSARLWLNANWPYAGLVAGCFYLAMLPLLRPVHTGFWSEADLLLYLQLPIYILHQLEEHFHDRFRRYINRQLANGLEVLTPDSVTVINVVGIWCVDLFAIYAAGFGHRQWGLVAFYLALVNVLVHVAGALRLRQYNPGLVTALFLLLPASALGAWLYSRQYALSLRPHLESLLFAVALHAAMVVHVLRRRAVLLRLGMR